ncbi:hypothetical protein NPIL_161901, partial [Nephila pilipes]
MASLRIGKKAYGNKWRLRRLSPVSATEQLRGKTVRWMICYFGNCGEGLLAKKKKRPDGHGLRTATVKNAK